MDYEKMDEYFIPIDENKIHNIVMSYWKQMEEYTILTKGMAGVKIGETYYVCDNKVLWDNTKFKEEEK